MVANQRRPQGRGKAEGEPGRSHQKSSSVSVKDNVLRSSESHEVELQDFIFTPENEVDSVPPRLLRSDHPGLVSLWVRFTGVLLSIVLAVLHPGAAERLLCAPGCCSHMSGDFVYFGEADTIAGH